jgi:hypothetical protein
MRPPDDRTWHTPTPSLTWPQPLQREALRAPALSTPASGGIDKRPSGQEEEEGDGMVEKKTRGKASTLIRIHVGSVGNIQLAYHVSVTCILGYI